MMRLIRDMLGLLTRPERRRGIGVLALAIINAGLEAMSVVSVFPFLALLAKPEILTQSARLRQVYDALGFESRTSFILALGVFILVLAVVTTVVRLIADKTLVRYAFSIRHAISMRVFARYLAQQPAFFLTTNSSEITTTTIVEVDHLVSVLIKPLFQLVAASFTSLLLIALMGIVDVRLVGLVLAGFGVGYGLFYFAVRRKLARLGERRRAANKNRYRLMTEALGGIKDLKLLGVEEAFYRRYEKSSRASAQAQGEYEVISHLPKNVIQLLAFGGIILTSLYFVVTRRDMAQALPVIGLFAVAAYRLMPWLQQAYASITSIRFGSVALGVLKRKLDALPASDPPSAWRSDERLPVQRSIRLENVTFSYSSARRPATHDVSLEIPVNSAVAFVGSTGAGKTTAADLLLALLEPSEGQLTVDGVKVTPANRRAWQNNVGYVAQNIFLTDDTVARNIAFGTDAIDMEAVKAAASLAQIDHFITSELPQGYDTPVGERGVRLSGGQRQRLGIARALYRNPAVIVFDEATSHLDNATEDAVVQAVASLAGQKTVVIIAHRLTTVRHCDRIFVFSQGSVVASGTYQELRESSPEFRRIADVSRPELVGGGAQRTSA